MKFWRTTILLSLGLALAACGNQQPKKANSNSSHVKVAASSSKRNTGATLSWNQTKADKLAAFMKDFGPTKSQQFTQADLNDHVKWQGLDLTKVYKTKQPITIDGKKTPVTWLPKKGHASKTQENVVAVYVDDQDTVLFLFTLTAQRKTRVLISQYAPDGQIIKTTDTTNQAVTQGFQNIVAGKKAMLASQTTATSSSKTATTDQNKGSQAATPKQQAIVPAEFQHTWYTQDGSHKLSTVAFTANTTTEAGIEFQIFPYNAENEADIEKSNSAPVTIDPKKENWDVGNYSASDKTLGIRNWYQKVSTLYKITPRVLDGQTIPVLEEADSYTHYANYYLTPALAAKYQDKVFPDQHVQ
ncbi:DUF4767 domain-containing protein [Lacticaseibacillus hegangensis]|uniref:DUF4767 domain-containing protein n=1 Tax=Lacticaseibacillus hegangensis TaxID=2486010 RepID=A0ABW4CRS7_9LACO|nr:DUF4767 domain-containing protein [Lacticaseibacillus hegangensis]